MVNNEARQFGIYLLAQIIPVFGELGNFKSPTGTVNQEWLTKLGTTVPGIDVNQFKDVRVEQLPQMLYPKIVEHYATKYQPGSVRAAS